MRYWLIRKLIGDDTVVFNAHIRGGTVCVCRGQSGYLEGNLFEGCEVAVHANTSLDADCEDFVRRYDNTAHG